MDLTTYNEEEKISMVEEFKSREISISEFAREKGIPATTFRGWLKQERELEFGRIDINKKSAGERRNTKKIKQPTVFVTENIRIELKEGFNKVYLRKIMEVLIGE